jgi:hypothetical protein
MATARGIDPFLKAALPTRVLKRRGQSLRQRAPGSSPMTRGLGPTRHASWPRTEETKTAARGACNRPAVTSTPPSSPKPAVERVGHHGGGMQPHRGGAPLQLRHVQHGGPGPHVM